MREWGVAPPGYIRHPDSGALDSTPWPDDIGGIRSLGADVIRWCEAYLVHHLDGKPWRFTLDQKRYLVLWYAVDEDGRWLYRSGTMRRSKGAGKDPFGASLILAELLGPTKFAGFNADGTPIAQQHRKSLVLVAANSETQACEILSVANELVSPELARDEGYLPGKVQASAAGGRRIKILTTSERSNEGDPATAVILNESHHMTASSGGQAIAAVARRNVGKSPGGLARVIELTNAHEEGGGSVAEDTYLAWQSQVGGKTRNQDILYSSLEADPSLSITNHDDMDLIVAQSYMYAPWINRDRIAREIDDTRVSVADSIRFYANGLAAAATAWVEPGNVRATARPDIAVDEGERITLALDCSKSGDATTLVGCRVSDGHVFALGLWQRPRGERGSGWLVPRDEVDFQVRKAFSTYDVAWFGVDPSPATDDETERSYWQPLVDQWHRDYHTEVDVWASTQNSVQYDLRQSIGGGKERLRLFTEHATVIAAAIDETQTLTHDGDAALMQHMVNARRRPNEFGIGIGKANRDSKDKVDYAVTMIIASLGRRLILNAPEKKTTKRPGIAWAW